MVTIVEVSHSHIRAARMAVVINIITIVSVSVAADGTDKPRRAAGAPPGPVLLEIILTRLDVAARNKDNKADKAVEDGINENATGQRC
jgi:hypothetical protein